MRVAALFWSSFALASGVLAASWKTGPFNPPAIPLAVSSPYTSTWLNNGNGTALFGDWPHFWTGAVTAWLSMVNVDGTTYATMAPPSGSATVPKQLSMKFTSTSTVFVIRCGPVDFTYTFLSPIDTDDLVRFSLPFSYLYITAASNDGKAHKVKVYSDITAEWLATDNNEKVSWSTSEGPHTMGHEIQLADQRPFQETSQRILHGTVFFSILKRDNLTYRIGPSGDLRDEFVSRGTLTPLLETGPRAIKDRWPTFAFAVDLGSVGAQGLAEPVVFGIGHARDKLVQFNTKGQIQERVPYFMTRYTSLRDAMEFFMTDHENAARAAALVDAQIEAHAKKVSDNYAALVALSMRQAFAAMELTVPIGTTGDTDDVLLFVRQNSAGYDGAINGVDVLYAMWPLFSYVNPRLLKAAIEPTLRYAAEDVYPSNFCLRSAGPHYPNATGQAAGDDMDHPMPVEASADILILTLSHAQISGDGSLLTTYYAQLDKWATYLQDTTLTPTKQEQGETFADSVAKMSNLAVKGIIAIAAMGEIAKMTNHTQDADKYSTMARNYITQWKSLAMSKDGKHLTFTYDNDNSYMIGFNLLADKLLKLGLVPDDIYATQQSWYEAKVSPYGLKADSRYGWTVSNWEIWAIAYMKDATLQRTVIDHIVAYYSSGIGTVPMANYYEADTGKVHQFQARPDVAGHLAFIALQCVQSSLI
ncbi:putative glutaminase A [Exidia glandulosa HHB12029]|uniref:Putative glutaminase A n=1 Tax=Exidia glandulosa HHB12029 TaxID=1314781 RepID=A0A165E2D9_EXIGL|nr:putative glutaminase A [Exidia glandulosa HHB12029]